MNAVPVSPATVEQPVTEVDPNSTSVTKTEHELLTVGTADLWRQLAHLCMETP